MKKFLLLSIVGITGLLVFICGCKQEPSGPAYTIKMNFAREDSFTRDIEAVVQTGIDMGKNDVEMTMDMKTKIGYHILGDSAGYTMIKMTYKEVKYGMDMKGIPGSPENSNETFNKMAEKTEGKSVVLLVNKKNEIEDVTGFNELTSSDSLLLPEGQQNKMFSKDQINSMMGLMFVVYPDKPVKVGEKWEKQTEITFGAIKMKMNYKFKLTGVKDSFATIEVKSDYKGKGEMEQGGMNIEMDMDGAISGTMYVDLRNGFLRDADQKIKIDATANIMGQKIPYKITGTTIIKGE